MALKEGRRGGGIGTHRNENKCWRWFCYS